MGHIILLLSCDTEVPEEEIRVYYYRPSIVEVYYNHSHHFTTIGMWAYC